MINFTPFPVLTTERLMLKQPDIKDADIYFFLRSDKRVNQHVKRNTPKTLQDAQDFIQHILKLARDNEAINWAICWKETGEMMGSICLWNFSEDLKTGEVGYDLHPDFQGKGIMSEALKAVLDFGFNTLDFHQIEAYTQYQNESSVGLLRKHHFQLVEGKRDEGNADNRVFELKK